MRRLLTLFLAMALAASAGCFGNDDEEPPVTTPTDGQTPPTGGTPTTTPTTPDGNETPPEPETPAPREVYTGTADFQRAPNADPANPTTTTENPFSVPPQYRTLTLNVTWTLATPAGVSGGVSVDVVDADGAVIATCGVPQGPVTAAPTACTATGSIPTTGGEYSANYVGEGTLQATVSVVAS